MAYLPLPPIQVTYTERIAYPTASLIIGQYFYQTDTDTVSGSEKGYYVWTGLAYIYAMTLQGGPTIIDGRGPNPLASAGLLIYNTDKDANGKPLIVTNDSNNDALLGLLFPIFLGMSIDQQTGEVSVGTLDGQVLGLWSRSAAGVLTRLLDLKRDTGNANKIEHGLYFGDAAGYGQIQITPSDAVSMTETPNSGASENDVTRWTIPAKTLVVNNQAIEFFSAGVTAANANNKQARIKIGGVVTISTGSVAANNLAWSLKLKIWRTAATTFKYVGEGSFSGNSVQRLEGSGTLVSGNWTAAQTFVVGITGAATNDIYVKESEAYVYN